MVALAPFCSSIGTHARKRWKSFRSEYVRKNYPYLAKDYLTGVINLSQNSFRYTEEHVNSYLSSPIIYVKVYEK